MPQLPKTPGRNRRTSGAAAAGAAIGYGATSPTAPTGADGITTAAAGGLGGTASAVQNGVGSEHTPLIPRVPRLHTLDGLNKPATTWTEFGVLARSSIPLSAGLALENALSTINILVVTTLGEYFASAPEGAPGRPPAAALGLVAVRVCMCAACCPACRWSWPELPRW